MNFEDTVHSSAHHNHDTFYGDGLAIKRILLFFFMILCFEEFTEFIGGIVLRFANSVLDCDWVCLKPDLSLANLCVDFRKCIVYRKGFLRNTNLVYRVKCSYFLVLLWALVWHP